MVSTPPPGYEANVGRQPGEPAWRPIGSGSDTSPQAQASGQSQNVNPMLQLGLRFGNLGKAQSAGILNENYELTSKGQAYTAAIQRGASEVELRNIVAQSTSESKNPLINAINAEKGVSRTDATDLAARYSQASGSKGGEGVILSPEQAAQLVKEGKLAAQPEKSGKLTGEIGQGLPQQFKEKEVPFASLPQDKQQKILEEAVIGGVLGAQRQTGPTPAGYEFNVGRLPGEPQFVEAGKARGLPSSVIEREPIPTQKEILAQESQLAKFNAQLEEAGYKASPIAIASTKGGNILFASGAMAGQETKPLTAYTPKSEYGFSAKQGANIASLGGGLSGISFSSNIGGYTQLVETPASFGVPSEITPFSRQNINLKYQRGDILSAEEYKQLGTEQQFRYISRQKLTGAPMTNEEMAIAKGAQLEQLYSPISNLRQSVSKFIGLDESGFELKYYTVGNTTIGLAPKSPSFGQQIKSAAVGTVFGIPDTVLLIGKGVIAGEALEKNILTGKPLPKYEASIPQEFGRQLYDYPIRTAAMFVLPEVGFRTLKIGSAGGIKYFTKAETPDISLFEIGNRPNIYEARMGETGYEISPIAPSKGFANMAKVLRVEGAQVLRPPFKAPVTLLYKSGTAFDTGITAAVARTNKAAVVGPTSEGFVIVPEKGIYLSTEPKPPKIILEQSLGRVVSEGRSITQIGNIAETNEIKFLGMEEITIKGNYQMFFSKMERGILEVGDYYKPPLKFVPEKQNIISNLVGNFKLRMEAVRFDMANALNKENLPVVWKARGPQYAPKQLIEMRQLPKGVKRQPAVSIPEGTEVRFTEPKSVTSYGWTKRFRGYFKQQGGKIQKANIILVPKNRPQPEQANIGRIEYLFGKPPKEPSNALPRSPYEFKPEDMVSKRSFEQEIKGGQTQLLLEKEQQKASAQAMKSLTQEREATINKMAQEELYATDTYEFTRGMQMMGLVSLERQTVREKYAPIEAQLAKQFYRPAQMFKPYQINRPIEMQLTRAMELQRPAQIFRTSQIIRPSEIQIMRPIEIQRQMQMQSILPLQPIPPYMPIPPIWPGGGISLPLFSYEEQKKYAISERSKRGFKYTPSVLASLFGFYARGKPPKESAITAGGIRPIYLPEIKLKMPKRRRRK